MRFLEITRSVKKRKAGLDLLDLDRLHSVWELECELDSSRHVLGVNTRNNVRLLEGTIHAEVLAECLLSANRSVFVAVLDLTITN